jgi:hypothetical protein
VLLLLLLLLVHIRDSIFSMQLLLSLLRDPLLPPPVCVCV